MMNNTMNHTTITKEQALQSALDYAGLTAQESVCLRAALEDGLYHLFVRGEYLSYEFYVEALGGEVLGIDSRPLPYTEQLRLCSEEEGPAPAAA